MKAVVMAGGKGTRLRPLTVNLPKPMVPVVGKPVMEHIVELLKKHGIVDIVVTLQFMPEVIRGYFGDGTSMEMNISYAVEDSPLGTAGSVRNVQSFLGKETFLVISGDALTDINLTDLIDFHKRKGALATVCLKSVENPLDFGLVITNAEGRIERFLEKPDWSQVFSDTINTGIYVLEPEIFDYIEPQREVDFARNVFPKLLKQGQNLYGYTADGYWCDIGNLEQYRQAHRDVLDSKVDVCIPGVKMRRDIWVGENIEIARNVDIFGPVFIGNHSKLKRGARLGEYTVIGDNVVVGNSSVIDRTIIWDNTFIGDMANIRGAIIGKNCDIRNMVIIEEGVAIGDDCEVRERAIIKHDVRVYPSKIIDKGAFIKRSIIWESRGTRTLFGKEGVRGLLNIDITPEVATKLAMAYGTTLPPNSKVTTSRDASRASRMIKRAMISGLSSTGVHIQDLRVAPPAVNRFNVYTGRAEGGVHARAWPSDPNIVQINFFNSNGIDIDMNQQREIEKFYHREEFRRAFYDEVGEIVFPARTVEYYRNALLSAIDLNVIQQTRLKVILDYAYGSASLILPSILGRLRTDVVSINAYTDEDIAMVTEELNVSLDRLSSMVNAFKADLGVMIDSASEKIYLVDENGDVVPPPRMLLLLIKLMGERGRGGKIIVPVTVTSRAEELAESYDCQIVRTKVSSSAIMEASMTEGAIFAGDLDGSYIFPKFLPAYDAVMAFCKILELLSLKGEPLSRLVDSLPEFNVDKETVSCSWEMKGVVMRKITEECKHHNKRVELINGVKIFEKDGWVLVLPDVEEPVFHLFCESKDGKNTRVYLDKYMDLIKSMVV